MCGIIGCFNDSFAFKVVVDGLKIMKNRGKDGYGVSDFKDMKLSKQILKQFKGENFVGHCLHAVVDKIEQPIKKKGVLVYNGEIYNWKELNKKYKLKVKNDAELLIQLLDKEDIKKVLEELDGVYSFAYWKDNKVVLCRDIIGVKPLWYNYQDGFCFASEKKALEKQGYLDVVELNPRKIAIYDLKNRKLEFENREFFGIKDLRLSEKEIKKRLKGLVVNSVAKRIPDKKFGILFSGGVDSTTIALICKELGVDFTCYVAALDEKGMEKAKDLVVAQKAAKKYGFKLKEIKIGMKDVEKYLKKIVPLIEDSNVVKVGVALPFYLACEQAKKDKIKVIFSGLGSEELFAGYDRHKKSGQISKECISGLLKMYERDLYRDDVVAMANSLEMRLPFLDKSLVEFSLKINEKYKIKDNMGKYIFREISEELGLGKEIAFRPKKAAQYGSKFDKAIAKLAKKEKKLKSEYLRKFYPEKNLKLGALISGGKDSWYAAYVMQRQNYDVNCLITVKSKNKFSYMFHTPNIDMVDKQAKAMDVDLISVETKGEKEKELKDLAKALMLAKQKHKIEGVVTGALFSNYQRERVEKIADKLGLKIFSPLWHIDQLTLMNELVSNEFEVILSSVAADGFDKKWLGRKVDEKAINDLVKLNDKIGINVAGEGGEYESLVLDCPMFDKKIEIVKAEKKMTSEFNGFYVIENVKLVEK